MKRFTLALVTGLAATLLTGCLATSVAPFYSTKDLSFNPELLGDWVKVAEPNEHWQFEKQGTNAYRLAYTSDGKTTVMQAHFFKLRGQSFLDLFTTELKDDVQPPPIPSHYLLRVLQTTPNLRMAPMDYAWLKNWLTTHPKSIAHQIIRNGEKSDEDRLVLTADTEKLQAFIIRHLNTPAAWKEDFELKREPSSATN